MNAPAPPTAAKQGCLCLGFTLFAAAVSTADPGPLVIEAAGSDQYTLEWYGHRLRPYQVIASENLLTWLDVPGALLVGNDEPQGLLVSPAAPVPARFFYRLREGAIRPGFDSFTLPSGDDNQNNISQLAEIGFGVKYRVDLNNGNSWTSCYVNNNGNISFKYPFGDYTPGVSFLSYSNAPIIAPFWADVDTRSVPQGIGKPVVVTYGQGMVDGRSAFGVTWADVGYYDANYDKLNSFQLVLIDRSAGNPPNGDFDIEFNYNQIQWETGDFSNGSYGYGGVAARAGISDGDKLALELEQSGESLSFIDTVIDREIVNPVGPVYQYTDTDVPNYPSPGTPGTGALKYRMHGNTVPGRMVFQVRNGTYLAGLGRAVIGNPTYNAGAAYLTGNANAPAGASVTYRWSVDSGAFIISAPTSATTAVQPSNPYNRAGAIRLTVEVNSGGVTAKSTAQVAINIP